MNMKRTLLQGAFIVMTAATLAACQGSGDGDDAKAADQAPSTEQQSLNNGGASTDSSTDSSTSTNSIPAAPAANGSASGSSTGSSSTTN
ncbi:hypothetical protein MSP8887_03823 [Marinomonas spartinae]|uniref:hypothetical protein n=1 Tax=Marinomonas spartinae TaxID=1792290 RepID=UPI000808A6B4|nr:hypothetical protein [Marinomonas spartinae]SBS39445.1 hypothetical protein MSP8887_03823 [Marinomonas spartinae]